MLEIKLVKFDDVYQIPVFCTLPFSKHTLTNFMVAPRFNNVVTHVKFGYSFRNRYYNFAPFNIQETNSFSFTGLFISPSGIFELDCATTKTDTAERSISIGRESLQVFFLY